MPWWVWLLSIWGVVGLAVSFWIGAAAAIARRRERAVRAHQRSEALERDRREAG
ncbi:hypothetical protein [Blastococcus mobilis]|uniref:Heme exporter protein D n=1 Tax=Blastococcus mobilis TaxID=1938746 RepID=A0A238VG44_9ACTN|nr:hypothetical protein [Blastococcus mobilis]SNR33226.1 hypothetical protein SAMN06272737_103106 [Blastococcus mobilis]